MNLWIDIADTAQATVIAAAAFARSVISRGADRTPPETLTALSGRAVDALKRAQREEKVALLALVVVLVFLSWP